MKFKETSLTTICAILVVFGAGALQFAVAIATILDPLVRILFCVTIIAVIIMDALVVHAIGNTPSNKVQKGVALFMLVTLFVGLTLDVILLLTHEAFDNAQFGWLRAFVGINLSLSLVLAAAFFAFSDTNTHERQIKKLQNTADMTQSKAFLQSPEAAALFRAINTAQILEDKANELGIPVYKLTSLLGLQDVTSLLDGTDAPIKQVTSRPIPPAPHPEVGTPEHTTNGHKPADSFR